MGQSQKGIGFIFVMLMYNFYAFGFAALLIILLLPFAVLALMVNRLAFGNLFYGVCRVFARFWLLITGIRYNEIYSKTTAEKSNQQFIYIANHRSYIDIVMMLAFMRTTYRPLGKAEMARIPIFGFFYNRLLITINRSDVVSRSIGFVKLKRTLEKGLSVFIFPEGTFNQTGNPLGAFYHGPFKLALKTGMNIKPMVFLDDIDRMNNKSLLTITPGICRVLLLEEIDIKQYSPADAEGLSNDVFNIMQTGLTELDARYI